MPQTIKSIWAAARSGAWLDRERLYVYSAMLLGLELLAFLFLYAGVNGWIVPLKSPVSTDFVSFYAAGHLADHGMPTGGYFEGPHYAAEQQAVAPGIPYMVYFYPPVFLLLCALLARLPYTLAFLAFECSTGAAWVAVVRRILRRAGDAAGERVALVAVLAYPALLINFGVGQNGFLTAALLGGATLLIDRRPALAGVLFGAMCYKPHFGLLVPIALIAGRRWRTVIAAAATVAVLVGLSGAVFGWDTWRVFLAAFTGSHSLYESGAIDFAAFVSPFGTLRMLGLSRLVAYGVQAVASLGAAGLVGWVWGRDMSLPTRAATLAAATVVAVPLTLLYDLLLAGLAMAWLVRAGLERGFLAWEKAILLMVFLMPLLVRGFGHSLHVPFGLVCTLALLGLCVAHARRDQSGIKLA